MTSKVEAAKLNTEPSRLAAAKKRKDNEENYYLNPKTCKHCLKVLPYDSRMYQFCDRTCAATYQNAKRVQNLNKCLSCGATIFKGKYCSKKCQHDYQYYLRIQKWDTSKLGTSVLKKWLRETYGDKCSECGITDWNDKPITLELEHKNGNSDDNSKENICLLCPNCHSQTPTFKAKNKGNGRELRLNNYHHRRKLALEGSLML